MQLKKNVKQTKNSKNKPNNIFPHFTEEVMGVGNRENYKTRPTK